MASKEEIAWAAGLFEGEGCITRKTNSKTMVLKLLMTDRDVVERLLSIAGAGSFYVVQRPPPLLQAYQWQCAEADKVEELLLLWMPWLGSRRRARAEEALRVLATNMRSTKVWTHCKRGHPLSHPNLIKSSRGERICRICHNLRNQANRRSEAQPNQREVLFNV